MLFPIYKNTQRQDWVKPGNFYNYQFPILSVIDKKGINFNSFKTPVAYDAANAVTVFQLRKLSITGSTKTVTELINLAAFIPNITIVTNGTDRQWWYYQNDLTDLPIVDTGLYEFRIVFGVLSDVFLSDVFCFNEVAINAVADYNDDYGDDHLI